MTTISLKKGLPEQYRLQEASDSRRRRLSSQEKTQRKRKRSRNTRNSNRVKKRWEGNAVGATLPGPVYNNKSENSKLGEQKRK